MSTLAHYYASVLRHSDKTPPTLAEAAQDYRRALDANRFMLELGAL